MEFKVTIKQGNPDEKPELIRIGDQIFLSDKQRLDRILKQLDKKFRYFFREILDQIEEQIEQQINNEPKSKKAAGRRLS